MRARRLDCTRGYASISFLHSAAEAIFARKEGQRTKIHCFGDHDPSGRDIDRAIVDGIGESLVALEGYTGVEDEDAWPDWRADTFDGYADFERVAVTETQIAEWDLPTRPTKRNAKDYRAKKLERDSVELDAISAPDLRSLAEDVIESHVNQHELNVLLTTEAEERRLLLQMAATFDGKRGSR